MRGLKKRMKTHIHTKNALRDISDLVRHIDDNESLWYKVNWVIVHTSHNICRRKGRIGHVKRQAIRHRLWRMAKRRHWVLRRYSIPFEIKGDSPCKIKWHHKIKPKKTEWDSGKYYHKNVPVLIAAIIIGIIIILVTIIYEKTLYEKINQILISFNPVSLDGVFILIFTVLILSIFCLFLLNSRGIKSNRYSKYAGYLAILSFFMVLFYIIFSYT